MNMVNEGVLPPDELDDRDERREEQESARRRATVADIVADIRERAENAMRNGERLVHNEAVANMLTFVADRIEAACKFPHAIKVPIEVVPTGNAAAMREALSDACYAMFNFLKTQSGGYEEMAIALDKAKAALAAPPRNCEVGTPEEQGERCLAQFEQWRRKGDGKKLITAIMNWAQMPYTAEEGGAE